MGAKSASEAFARGANGNMWQWTVAGWADTGLAMVGVPAVVVNGQHALDVFYRDPGNGLRQAWKTGAGWTSQVLPGVIVSDPAAVSWGPNRIDIVAFGGDYNLYHWSTAQAGFALPVAGVHGVGTPTIVSAASNSLDVVFRNLNAGVTRIFWNGSSWASEVLGGTIRGLPSAAVTAGPTRRVYALGTSQQLFERSKSGAAAWSAWQSVSVAAGASGVVLTGSPNAVVQTNGVVMVQARIFADNGLAIFTRPATWSFATAGATPLSGSAAALASGGAFAASPSSHLLFWNGSNWFDRGGIIE